MDICRLSKVEPEKMFSVSEYAKHIGVSKGRISQKVKSGELKVVKYKGGFAIYTG